MYYFWFTTRDQMSGSLSSAWRSAGSNFNFRGAFEHNRITSPQDSSTHSSSRRSTRFSGIMSFPKSSIAISCCFSDRKKRDSLSHTHTHSLTHSHSQTCSAEMICVLGGDRDIGGGRDIQTTRTWEIRRITRIQPNDF